ncbi:MAG: NUDIX domain-containing protein [Planctomycetes bacterium]|nr:NUDIX domain-containing protein [Planctomycetota bacterium]
MSTKAYDNDECFPLVDEEGAVIGTALRGEVHGNPALLHPVVHCVITNSAGDLLLQLRHREKKIQPGKWDTSVGGHVAAGEETECALEREVEEEVGLRVKAEECRFLYKYIMKNDIESELVHTYTVKNDGPFRRQESEIEELRFWSRGEIEAALGTGCFTPNFEDEWSRFSKAVH